MRGLWCWSRHVREGRRVTRKTASVDLCDVATPAGHAWPVGVDSCRQSRNGDCREARSHGKAFHPRARLAAVRTVDPSGQQVPHLLCLLVAADEWAHIEGGIRITGTSLSSGMPWPRRFKTPMLPALFAGRHSAPYTSSKRLMQLAALTSRFMYGTRYVMRHRRWLVRAQTPRGSPEFPNVPLGEYPSGGTAGVARLCDNA